MDIELPQYYVVRPDLSESEVSEVCSALSITPCTHAIISQSKDRNLVSSFCEHVIQVSEQKVRPAAVSLAQELKRPVLAVGEADLLDAIYADGTQATVLARLPERIPL